MNSFGLDRYIVLITHKQNLIFILIILEMITFTSVNKAFFFVRSMSNSVKWWKCNFGTKSLKSCMPGYLLWQKTQSSPLMHFERESTKANQAFSWINVFSWQPLNSHHPSVCDKLPAAAKDQFLLKIFQLIYEMPTITIDFKGPSPYIKSHFYFTWFNALLCCIIMILLTFLKNIIIRSFYFQFMFLFSLL